MEKQATTLDDLLQDTNPIGTMMQQEYQAYLELHLGSDQMRYTEYTEAVLQTGAFDYQSIRDGQLQIEKWVNRGTFALTIILGMTFPPARLALGTILGSMQIVSAVNGEDLISGRELSTGEQITRAAFGTISVTGGLYGLNAFSQNTAFVRGTKPGTLNHYGEMLKHSSKSNYIQLNQEAQVMHSMSTEPVLPGVDEVSEVLSKKSGNKGYVSSDDWEKYLQHKYGKKNVRNLTKTTISPSERTKINSWQHTPTDELYLEYKEVYNNEKYFNQATGHQIYPEKNGFTTEVPDVTS